jgi:hypothetical protein
MIGLLKAGETVRLRRFFLPYHRPRPTQPEAAHLSKPNTDILFHLQIATATSFFVEEGKMLYLSGSFGSPQGD